MPKQAAMQWSLPDVVHPDSVVCYTVKVPNERHYIGAFLGAMFLLSKPYAWGNDEAHTAIEVGAVWRRIFDDLISGECSVPHMEHGSEMEDFMPLRVDCDCNVWVTCCDGSEKQVLTADQVQNLIQNQPGIGAPQPQPGGGTQQYCATLSASGHYLFPALVSTGDTLSIDSVSGAGNDPSDPSGAFRWRLLNGDAYFGGIDIGLPVTDAGDPLPATNHMQLIVAIGDTPNYYPLTVGSLFTVPSGFSNAQIWLQVNDSSLADNNGDYRFCATLKNNQATTFTSTFDFTTSPYSGVWSITSGTWIPGSGFQGDTVGGGDQYLQLEATAAPFTAISGSLQYTQNAPLGAGDGAVIQHDSTFWFGQNGVIGSHLSINSPTAVAVTAQLRIILSSGSGGTGTNFAERMTIVGTGPKPAGWP